MPDLIDKTRFLNHNTGAELISLFALTLGHIVGHQPPGRMIGKFTLGKY